MQQLEKSLYDENNVFAKIIRKELACEYVYEDENNIAFKDIAPVAPLHILIIPKGKYIDYDDFIYRASAQEVLSFFQAVRKIGKSAERGYRIVSNCGRDANQLVLHFHVHLLAGDNLGGLIPADKLQR